MDSERMDSERMDSETTGEVVVRRRVHNPTTHPGAMTRKRVNPTIAHIFLIIYQAPIQCGAVQRES